METSDVKIPEALVINGVTYSVKSTPEIQAFINEVAKVEKSKLYTQIESLRHQINDLNKVDVVGVQNFNAEELINSLKGSFVTKDDFKTMLPEVMREVVKPILNATEEAKTNELNEYREKLLKENAATCIPDLVKGNSREELDASLKESIRLRSAYPANNVSAETKVIDPVIAKQMAETPVQPVVPTIPSTPNRPSPEASGASNIKKMSVEDFAKQRENLKQQIESMYGNGAN